MTAIVRLSDPEKDNPFLWYNFEEGSTPLSPGQNEILIKEFSPYVIDTNSKSPDGYELEPASYRSRGLLGELFGSNAGKHSHRVKKPGGRGFPISDYGSEFSYSNLSFIGWIIQSDQWAMTCLVSK